jgi:hypothetical protein
VVAEEADELEVAALHGGLQRRVAALLPHVGVGAALEEQRHDVAALAGDGAVDGLDLRRVRGDGARVRAAVEEQRGGGALAEVGGEVQRREAVGRDGARARGLSPSAAASNASSAGFAASSACRAISCLWYFAVRSADTPLPSRDEARAGSAVMTERTVATSPLAMAWNRSPSAMLRAPSAP